MTTIPSLLIAGIIFQTSFAWLDDQGCAKSNSKSKFTISGYPTSGAEIKSAFKKGTNLGTGGLGETREIAIQHAGKILFAAVKKISLTRTDLKIEEVKPQLKKEIQVLKEMSRKKAAPEFYVCFYSEKEVYIVQQRLFLTLNSNSVRYRVSTSPPSFLFNIVNKLIEALQKLWDSGWTHRDIKPQNIMLSPDFKKVFLIDFGSVLGFEEENTCQGGTPRFASHEFYVNERPTRESDLYSLCLAIVLLKGDSCDLFAFDKHEGETTSPGQRTLLGEVSLSVYFREAQRVIVENAKQILERANLGDYLGEFATGEEINFTTLIVNMLDYENTKMDAQKFIETFKKIEDKSKKMGRRHISQSPLVKKSPAMLPNLIDNSSGAWTPSQMAHQFLSNRSQAQFGLRRPSESPAKMMDKRKQSHRRINSNFQIQNSELSLPSITRSNGGLKKGFGGIPNLKQTPKVTPRKILQAQSPFKIPNIEHEDQNEFVQFIDQTKEKLIKDEIDFFAQELPENSELAKNRDQKLLDFKNQEMTLQNLEGTCKQAKTLGKFNKSPNSAKIYPPVIFDVNLFSYEEDSSPKAKSICGKHKKPNKRTQDTFQSTLSSNSDSDFDPNEREDQSEFEDDPRFAGKREIVLSENSFIDQDSQSIDSFDQEREEINDSKMSFNDRDESVASFKVPQKGKFQEIFDPNTFIDNKGKNFAPKKPNNKGQPSSFLEKVNKEKLPPPDSKRRNPGGLLPSINQKDKRPHRVSLINL